MTRFDLWQGLQSRPGYRIGLLCWVSCVALAAGGYAEFLQALAQRESSGNGRTVNNLGYAGLYQMGEAALIDAGYYRRDGTAANDWKGNWTGKNGIHSLSDFLSNPSEQTQAITGYHQVLWDQLTARGMDQRVGQDFQGVPITSSGLIAAAHLVGAGGLRQCLQGGACEDANHTTASAYMSQFGGFDATPVTGTLPPATSGGSGTNPSPPGSTTSVPTSNTQTAFPDQAAVSTDTAFSSGSGVSMSQTHELVLGVLSVVALLWVAWVTFGQLACWRDRKVSLFELQKNIISSLVFLSFVLFIALS